MSNVLMTDSNCRETLRRIDAYVDNEIDTAEGAPIAAHIETCPSCREELELRRRLRSRLKQAVDSSPAAPYLQTKVLTRVRASQPKTTWFGVPRYFVALAAMLVMTVGLTAIGYQLGHLRFTTGMQESYIASISSRVAGIMRVGLGDHVHCGVFRKYSKANEPSLQKMESDLGPDYKGLLQVVAPHVPEGFRVVLGHRCRYHGRQFVHLAMKNDRQLISIVIAHKQDGETFRNSTLVPVIEHGGVPIYHDGVQRFDITGFETRGHLVYLISDVPAKENRQLMIALAPTVTGYLAKLEG
jgi:anti-sigma factor (TIGR02949 family)